MAEKRLAAEEPGPGAVGRLPSDRVWLTLKRSYRVADYESLSVEMGAASSADPGETSADALRRVFAELKTEFGDVIEVMRAEHGA